MNRPEGTVIEARHEGAGNYCRCYRCDAGCIHIVCGPAMVRLTPTQFGELHEAVKGLAAQLANEQLIGRRMC